MRRSVPFALCLALAAAWTAGTRGLGGQEYLIRIPAGRPITIHGTISDAEWNDATSVEIRVSPEWTARVNLKHDRENLYFALEGSRTEKNPFSPKFCWILKIENRRG
jgi:hypothetical protein